MASELLLPTARALDANADPYNGAKWYFYASGTSTPQNVYSDSGLSTSLGSTVTADSGGKFVPIYFDSSVSYRGVLKDSTGATTLHDIDPINTGILSTLAASGGSALIGFIQSGTGAVARTVQSKQRDELSVKDFGAVGDGTTDDTTAMTNAITAALAQKKALYLPGGTYKITSRITVTMPNAASGGSATNYFSTLSIYGDGYANTVVHCQTTGFIKVVGSSQQHSVDLQGFTVAAGKAACGTAIEMDCSAYPFFGEWTARSTIRLHFRGNDGINNVYYWSTAVEAIDWSNIDFSHSWFDGASTPNGNGVITRKSAGSYVCVFDFIGCHFRFLSVGYNYGTGSQTANFDASFFAQNYTDVYAPTGINHQGLSITNCECYKGAAGDGVYLVADVPNFVFSGNRWGVHAGYRGIACDVTNQATITDNQFFPDVTANTATAAIDIDGTVSGSHCIIDGNNFASTTIGARLKSGSANVKFGGNNKWTSSMTGVTNAGTNNFVGHHVASPIGTVGYATGAGGTVTQATSKATAVTLNTPCGQITTNNAALAATTEVAFTLTNSVISATDVVHAVVGSGNYDVRVTDTASGSCIIRLKNLTGGSLSDAVTINFIVLRAVSA